ncbi:MAG: response regulator [Desulfobacteraceae bacterium]|nr:response regulator [Desulfobacteraceae bacterium]
MDHKLLIVDDEPRLRESLKLIFKNKGFSVQTASNGLDALNTFRNSPVKVIITDIQMPEMDGFEFFESIKKIDPFVQVIFLTGHPNIDYIKSAFKNKAFEFFKKPVNDNKILFNGVEKATSRYDNLKNKNKIKEKKEKSFLEITTIFDSLDAAVYISDLDTYELIYTNKQFNRELEVSEEKSFIGEKCWKILQKDQTGPCPNCTNKLIVDESGNPCGPYERESFNNRTQKHYRIVDKAIEWVDGRIVRFETAYDISEKRKYEKLAKKYEKTNETLKRLESLGRLSGGIAHQFNNALSIITGHLNLIEMDYQKEERLNLYIKQMITSAKKMTDLTSSLLAYARGGKYQAQNFPISDYVSNIIDEFKQDQPLMLTIIDEINAKDCFVKADKNQLGMLMVAVLKNAVEATQEIGTIKISCEKENPNQRDLLKENIILEEDYICLTFKDDGSGMDNEVNDRIFEPFFTTKFEGRGLGMAAAYGIVKNHDGYIFVDSNLEKGTIVKIYLPMIEKLNVPLPVSDVFHSKKDITVLLIEDDEAVMNVTKMMLNRKGYTVLQASSGKEAVELVRSYKGTINIALLDFVLPDMNGEIVYPLIQKHHPEMKVIVLSGYAITGPVQKLMNSGARAFIQKPVTMKKLFQKIKKVLES